VLGHATWHLYRRVVAVDSPPRQKEIASSLRSSQ
jgi:uncharacterized membrane protein